MGGDRYLFDNQHALCKACSEYGLCISPCTGLLTKQRKQVHGMAYKQYGDLLLAKVSTKE